MSTATVQVIGGGLAGSEAALQLASAGINVQLFEMRPDVMTPAHKTGGLAELVCSNSFKGNALTSAHGLFKHELLEVGSKLLKLAQKCSIRAGESLAVDRVKFSELVENAISSNPNIQLVREEKSNLDSQTYTIIATGPLTSPTLSHWLMDKIGKKSLAFFDSISPVVDTDSIDFSHAYYKNRWEKGDTEDFINCPLDEHTYHLFVDALTKADTIEEKPFEKKELFEGCLPIEELARRGPQTLSFGPMRPVGLMHPTTGEKPYAVLQLRAENREKTLYNLVGCQTRLKQHTQKEIFQLIPALRNATFARYGAMHRNTFIDSPSVLDNKLGLPGTRWFFAGQLTGAEGYTEAVATGLFAATMVYNDMTNIKDFSWPSESCLGALTKFLTLPNEQFQPMNLNFGLFPRPEKLKKSQKKEFIISTRQNAMKDFRLPWE
ncbi:MAG: methylenetetrahydrofolate--tRNA-(uracil(54)-C(5))-methyltransferase (FADH(2)-oxidizing) TrmFO [Fibrobacteria bacterium]|nr:methylenetetrahydrofolate--tRNA-(uracil(54)-C(5))-methyltransferase (FADH(2)-oxidizing) TrmFO [Fibrobacteria bacterium]